MLQQALPRPSVVDIDALLKKALDVSHPIEGAVAREMALLIANDALKYPVPGAKVRGSSKPLEAFDDEALNKARLEIALELPQDGQAERQEEFENAWEELHGSTQLPGLTGYGDDETDQHQLMVEAFNVSQISQHARRDFSVTDLCSENPSFPHGRRREREQDRKETRPASRRISAARQDPSREDHGSGGRVGEGQDQSGYFSHAADSGGGHYPETVGGVEGGGQFREQEGEGGAGGVPDEEGGVGGVERRSQWVSLGGLRGNK